MADNYNDLLFVRVLPIYSLTLGAPHGFRFYCGEIDSTYTVEQLTETTGYGEGHERPVGYVASVTFISPMNDYGNLEAQLDAFSRYPHPESAVLTLKAMDGQERGAELELRLGQAGTKGLTLHWRIEKAQMRPRLALTLTAHLTLDGFAGVQGFFRQVSGFDV